MHCSALKIKEILQPWEPFLLFSCLLPKEQLVNMGRHPPCLTSEAGGRQSNLSTRLTTIVVRRKTD